MHRSGISCRAVWALLFVATWWAISGTAAHAQQARPRSMDAPVQAVQAVATHAMPAVSNATLRADYPLPIGVGPLRFAEPLTTEITPTTHGTWETLEDGTHLWRLRIQSAEALSINLGFTTYQMPSGGELFVYAPEYESVIGPFTAEDNAVHGELWTPIVSGDEVVVEVVLPPDRRTQLQLVLGQVSHGFRSLDAISAAKRSGACNVDVACSQADPWRAQARAVGTYSFGGSRLCTGVLINNTAQNWRPYFLTADHCGVNETNAASMVVYWNFRNSTCREPSEAGGRGDGNLGQFNTGSFHRASYSGARLGISGGPDITLVELDDPIDLSYDVHFAGWNRQDAPTTRSVGIHHPQGQEKRISFDEDPSTVTSYLENTIGPSGPTHLRVGAWDLGTTEPGSSGSPLFDAGGHVVGVLSGGFAACASPAEDNNQPDWYGRFALGWNGGESKGTQLSYWLDPFDTAAEATSGLSLDGDDAPPAPIADIRVVDVADGQITLRWTATGDDGLAGIATYYDLRFSQSAIRDLEDFRSATPIEETLIPQPSGTQELYVFDSLKTNTPYYFALVARDKAGKASPLAFTRENVAVLDEKVIVQAAYPNPFRSTTTVGFAVDEEQRVRVDVYDAIGRRVQEVFDNTVPANTLREFQLGASGWASGVYFVRILGDRFERTTQVVRVQ